MTGYDWIAPHVIDWPTWATLPLFTAVAAGLTLLAQRERRLARPRARLTVDLSNKTAWITGPDGRTLVAWSDVTRRSAEHIATANGWELLGEWELTSPPDGFYRPVAHRKVSRESRILGTRRSLRGFLGRR